jgi:septal ring factor EnvC (AmiA/AmiB activator)
VSSVAVTWVAPGLVLAGAVLGLIRWYVRDRRKSEAEAELIEHTLDSDADLHDTGARDARLVYVQRQVDMERAFHVQQIADRDAEILRQRTELAHRDQQITSLLRQVRELERQLGEMTRQLTSVRSQLVQLAVHDNPTTNGDRP